MKKLIPLILVIVLVLSCGDSLAYRKLKDLSRDLPAGVKVYKCQSDDRNAVFYLAEVDRRYFPEIQFRTSVARGRILGRTTVRNMAQSAAKNGKNVIMAVNASFGELGGSYEGEVHNLHIQNRAVVSPPNRYACFGVTKSGEFFMEDVKMNTSIKIAGKKIQGEGLNEARRGSLALYTPKFGSSTKTRDGYEIVASAALPFTPRYKEVFTITAVNDSGNARIPRDGFVLSAKKGSEAAKLFERLKTGDQGELTSSFLPERWNDVIHAIGGNSRLVKKGKLVNDSHKGRNWAKDDPRTALGFNDEKLFLIVVDGRQSGYSRGMTYRDVGKTMLELGATEAINLDGGSSSTFIVQDHVVNRPSGGKERNVLNAVFITSEKKTELASSD